MVLHKINYNYRLYKDFVSKTRLEYICYINTSSTKATQPYSFTPAWSAWAVMAFWMIGIAPAAATINWLASFAAMYAKAKQPFSFTSTWPVRAVMALRKIGIAPAAAMVTLLVSFTARFTKTPQPCSLTQTLPGSVICLVDHGTKHSIVGSGGDYPISCVLRSSTNRFSAFLAQFAVPFSFSFSYLCTVHLVQSCFRNICVHFPALLRLAGGFRPFFF